MAKKEKNTDQLIAKIVEGIEDVLKEYDLKELQLLY